jgi:NTP pyrophosphatase (non-canonical NTP hydrolase)
VNFWSTVKNHKPGDIEKMNVAEYHSKTHVTCIVKEANLVVYMALGLAEESGEVLEAVHSLGSRHDTENALKELAMECGDVMWYTSECVHAWGVDLTKCSIDQKPMEAVTPSDWVSLLMKNALAVAGLTKKLIRDADLVIDEERRQKVAMRLGTIVHVLREILKFGPYDLEWVMEQNIEKLARRKNEGKLHGEGSNR